MERALALLAPADAIRRWMLASVGRWARPWIVERERRVALTLVVGVMSALVLASLVPIVLLALGPLVLGVPHLFADIRYLIVREGFHRRWPLWLLVALPLVMVGITSDVRWGWGAVIGAAIAAKTGRGGLWKRAAIVVLAGGFIALATKFGYALTLFIAHFHNVFALFVVWVWRRRSKTKLSLAPFALFLLASAFIFLGGFEPFVRLTNGHFNDTLSLDLDGQAQIFAPARSGVFGWRFVVFFAFAQSVHYAVWLRAMPDQARPSRTPRSFKQSARALFADLGAPITLIALGLCVALGVYALVDLVEARNTYFRFALFHGYLEFAVFALFFCEGSIVRGAVDEPVASSRRAVVS